MEITTVHTMSLFTRRTVLGSATLAATVGLASCATGGGAPETVPTPDGEVSEENPFGVAEDSVIDAVIFNGGYGTDYVDFAGEQLAKKFPSVTLTVKQATDIAGELQPRFVGGTPPDVIDNSGAKSIGFNAILSQLAELDDVMETKNYEGTLITDTLYEGALAPGTYDGRFVAINYVMTVYGMWYSGSLFDEFGWVPPTTWDEAIALGEKAKEQDKYLFCWGKEAATYYQVMAIESAIKQGGDEVRLALENLEEDCWSHPAIQSVFEALETIVSQDMILPGGSGTQFTAAQAQWSNSQEAILYPSGAWIENEMKSQTKDGFEMRGVPTPIVDSSSAMPYEALHSSAATSYIVPRQGKNVAGAKELMRAMLSNEAATNFSRTRLVPTVVRDLVPEDGFGSTALQSQNEMLAAAGEQVFDLSFVELYGMNGDMLTVWNSFLDGASGADELTASLQGLTDAVRNDPNVKKLRVD